MAVPRIREEPVAQHRRLAGPDPALRVPARHRSDRNPPAPAAPPVCPPVTRTPEGGTTA